MRVLRSRRVRAGLGTTSSLIGECVVLPDVGLGFSHLAWSVVEEVIHLGCFLGLESLKILSGSLVLRYLLELDGLCSGDF